MKEDDRKKKKQEQNLIYNYHLTAFIIQLAIRLQSLNDVSSWWSFAGIFCRTETEKLHHLLIGTAQSGGVQWWSGSQTLIIRILIKFVFIKRVI